jgi:hypothetical protein
VIVGAVLEIGIEPTSATVSMTPATPVETTGEIVLSWSPGGRW